MLKINRYLIQEFLTFFFYCFSSIAAIAILFEVFVEIGKGEIEEIGWNGIFWNILSQIPLLIDFLTPITTLIATTLTLYSLSKTSEIIAIKAAGRSTFQILWPLLLTSTLMAGFSYCNQSYLAKWLQSKSSIQLSKKNAAKNVQWRIRNNQIYFFRGALKKDQTVKQIINYQFSPTLEIAQKKKFLDLHLSEKNWSINKTISRKFGKEYLLYEKLKKNNLQVQIFPQIFKDILSKPVINHPILTIYFEIQRLKKNGLDVQHLWMAIFQKIAGIFTIPIMVLLAFPFSIFSARHDNPIMGIITAIILGFCFILLDKLFLALNHAGALVNWIAAFAPNVIFICLSSIIFRMKKD
ncbi:MAG: lipopolysaccharide export system permease protein [bacterium]|jgi:lipopolysaccharide export system permease protein